MRLLSLLLSSLNHGCDWSGESTGDPQQSHSCGRQLTARSQEAVYDEENWLILNDHLLFFFIMLGISKTGQEFLGNRPVDEPNKKRSSLILGPFSRLLGSKWWLCKPTYEKLETVKLSLFLFPIPPTPPPLPHSPSNLPLSFWCQSSIFTVITAFVVISPRLLTSYDTLELFCQCPLPPPKKKTNKKTHQYWKR